MSVQFTDLLLELCEPRNLRSYLSEKQAYLSRFDLSDEEKATLDKPQALSFRRHADSIPIGDRRNPVHQFARSSLMMDVIVHPELHIEVTVPTTADISAIEFGTGSFVDDNGTYYTARSRALGN